MFLPPFAAGEILTRCIAACSYAQSEPFRGGYALTPPGERRRRPVQAQPLRLPPQEKDHRLRTGRRRTADVVKVIAKFLFYRGVKK